MPIKRRAIGNLVQAFRPDQPALPTGKDVRGNPRLHEGWENPRALKYAASRPCLYESM
jgi:hypothetical protein